jgi:hypothetical protein
MRTVAVLGVALLAVSFVAEGSSARTESTSEASLQGKKFVSKKYGYEFVFPAGDYYAEYATLAWNSKVFPSGGTGLVDLVAYANTSDRKFVAAATHPVVDWDDATEVGSVLPRPPAGGGSL